MQTSCQNNDEYGIFALYNLKLKQRGFTLVEMLAALVVLGLMTGLLLPNFQRWYDGTQQRVQAAEIGLQTQRLYARAALLGQGFELNEKTRSNNLADGKPALTLPLGWRLADNQRLNIPASGFCETSALQLMSSGNLLKLSITAPACEVGYEYTSVKPS
jgi:prepilin-type N-terminal cleavage/methylation domain-containing protein